MLTLSVFSDVVEGEAGYAIAIGCDGAIQRTWPNAILSSKQ
jgi:hypothetical protein